MLRPEEAPRRLRLKVLAFATLAPALVRLPLLRLERILEPHQGGSPASVAEIAMLGSQIDAILAQAPRFVRRGCLTRGVTQYFFLRRASADIELAFGMGKHGDEFAGHCWLVRDGEPFLEQKDPRELFSEMYVIPFRTGRALA